MNKFAIYTFFLASLILNGGCKINRGTPAIKRDKMVEILTDIHLAQAIVEQETVFPKGYKKEYFYCNILERHGVNEELFDSAITWYAANLDIFEQMYVEIIARLENERKELENTEKEKKEVENAE